MSVRFRALWASLGLITAGAPALWPEMPEWLHWISLSAGVGLLVLTVLSPRMPVELLPHWIVDLLPQWVVEDSIWQKYKPSIYTIRPVTELRIENGSVVRCRLTFSILVISCFPEGETLFGTGQAIVRLTQGARHYEFSVCHHYTAAAVPPLGRRFGDVVFRLANEDAPGTEAPDFSQDFSWEISRASARIRNDIWDIRADVPTQKGCTVSDRY